MTVWQVNYKLVVNSVLWPPVFLMNRADWNFAPDFSKRKPTSVTIFGEVRALLMVGQLCANAKVGDAVKLWMVVFLKKRNLLPCVIRLLLKPGRVNIQKWQLCGKARS